jgi:hypothetical protein
MPSLVLKAEDAPKLKGDHLNLSTVQKKDFDGKTAEIPQKYRP